MLNQTTIQTTNLLELNCFSNLHQYLVQNNEFCSSMISCDLEDAYSDNFNILMKNNLANKLRLDALNFYVDMYKLGFGSDYMFKSLLSNLACNSEFINLDSISDDLSKSVCDLYKQYLQYFASFFDMDEYLNCDFMNFIADLTPKDSDTFQGLSLIDSCLCVVELKVKSLSDPYRNAVMGIASMIIQNFNAEAISIEDSLNDEEYAEILTGDSIGINQNYLSTCSIEDIEKVFSTYSMNEISELNERFIIESLYQCVINKNDKDETLADYENQITHHLSSLNEYFGEDSLILNNSIATLKYLEFVSKNTTSTASTLSFKDRIDQMFKLLPPAKTDKEKEIYSFFEKLQAIVVASGVCDIKRISVQTDEANSAYCNVVSYDFENYDPTELYDELGGNVECSGIDYISFVDSASDVDPLIKLNCLSRVLLLALLKATEIDD